MRYFLDTEFNGFGGELISLALVSELGDSLYAVAGCEEPEPWVAENVIPILDDCPINIVAIEPAAGTTFGGEIAKFLLAKGGSAEIVTDWPDDIRYFCEALITGPGQMVPLGALTFHMVRVDAYPTTLSGAVQHNAWWDAMALRERFLRVPA